MYTILIQFYSTFFSLSVFVTPLSSSENPHFLCALYIYFFAQSAMCNLSPIIPAILSPARIALTHYLDSDSPFRLPFCLDVLLTLLGL